MHHNNALGFYGATFNTSSADLLKKMEPLPERTLLDVFDHCNRRMNGIDGFQTYIPSDDSDSDYDSDDSYEVKSNHDGHRMTVVYSPSPEGNTSDLKALPKSSERAPPKRSILRRHSSHESIRKTSKYWSSHPEAWWKKQSRVKIDTTVVLHEYNRKAPIVQREITVNIPEPKTLWDCIKLFCKCIKLAATSQPKITGIDKAFY